MKVASLLHHMRPVAARAALLAARKEPMNSFLLRPRWLQVAVLVWPLLLSAQAHAQLVAFTDPAPGTFGVTTHASATTAQIRSIDAASPKVLTNFTVNPHEPLGPCSRKTPMVFSEIMYKPAPRTDARNVEFLEIYNSNPFFQDISSYQIVADNLAYTFPTNTTIPGGGFICIAASPTDITSVYGMTNVFGPYTGSLKKSGTIQLLDEVGAVLLTVPYANVYPWPVAADGTGHSIVLAYPSYGEGDPRAWDISDVAGGSPGAAEPFTPSPLRSVVINEILAHSENPSVLEFVELYNHSSVTNDVSGCSLTDDPTTNKFVLPNGTTILRADLFRLIKTSWGLFPTVPVRPFISSSPTTAAFWTRCNLSRRPTAFRSGAGRTARTRFIR